MPTNNAQWAVFVQRLQDAINATRDAANRTGVNVVPAAYAVYDAATLPALSINGASAALDGTKSQFGKASLKLTATGATITVSFTGNPIAITAYQRWIESVYIQSSRASIGGTLAVVTPAASYPVDISGTLLPATWGRLYGDCSLVADASTQATMTLTLTGCSVGDTFNLEGWQLEQAAGNTNLPSAFVNSAAPGSQDTLPDGSSFVRLAGSHASGNVAYNYRGVWSSATAYVTGDEVVYSGSYWLCLTGNTNSAPAQGNGNWQVVGAYNNYQGAWSSTVTYYAGQETTYNGNYWVATATNTNSAPSTSNANWVIAGPQNLDHVADGTGRFAVVNGGGLNAVAAVDPNKKALIDFTQAGHTGKTLANMPDDTLSNRYAVASIDPNRKALIDFTQGGHVNKNLDNIADSATYLRTIQQSQAETVDNANFEVSTSLPVPGWTANGTTLSYNTSIVYAGTQSLNVTASAQFQNLKSSRVYKCAPGEVYYATIEATGETTGAWAFGLADGATGDILGTVAIPAKSPVWGLYAVKVTIPSGIASFQLIFFRNTAAASNACVIDNVTLARVRSLDTEVGDGATYGRLANADLYSSGGVNRLGLRVPDSGQTLGDQRNLNPITWAGVRSTQSVSPLALSYDSAAPANLSFTCAAVSFQGGGYTTSYSASSASTTQTRGTGPVTYYFYYRDANNSGGSKTLNFTTNQSDLSAYPDVVYLGLLTIAIPAGTGTGSGTQFTLGGQSGGGAGALPAK